MRTATAPRALLPHDKVISRLPPRFGIAVRPSDPRPFYKPLTGRDHFGAQDQAGAEAVTFRQTHDVVVRLGQRHDRRGEKPQFGRLVLALQNSYPQRRFSLASFMSAVIALP